tara:strand:+ start:3887 stop:5356 length:1470 start_codon:yes stop_codon:yes gene_type:complete
MLSHMKGTTGAPRLTMNSKAVVKAYLGAQGDHLAAKARERDAKTRRRQRGPAAPRVALTMALCEWLPVEQCQYEVRDTEVRNLVVRVRPTGGKVLYVAKKINGRNARSKVCDLGSLPFKRAGGWTGDTVHSRARALLAEMESGQTATVKRQARRTAEAESESSETTVVEAATYYIELKGRAENTQAAYKRFRDKQLAAHWPDKRIVEVTTDDVIALHAKISAGEGRGYGPVAANNVVRFFRAVWKANRRRLGLGECPTIAFTAEGGQEVAWHSEKRRQRYIRQNELADWWQAVQALRGTITGKRGVEIAAYHGDGDLMADYLEFALLTGMRRREITSLSRKRGAPNRIDKRNRELVVTENKSNHARAREDRTLRLPITPALQAILDRREGDNVFPLDDPKKAVDWIEKQCSLRISSHDLRRTFLTYATAIGMPLPVSKTLVNHSAGGDVTEGYIQVDDTTRRDWLVRLQNHLLALAGARDNVVQIVREA